MTEEVTIYKCKFCEKEFTTRRGCSYHESHCEKNPNRKVQHTSEETKKKLSEKMKQYIAIHKEEHRHRSIESKQKRTEEDKKRFKEKQQSTWNEEKRKKHADKLKKIYEECPELHEKVANSVKIALNKPEMVEHLSKVRKARYTKLYEDPVVAEEYFRQKAITAANNNQNITQDSLWEKRFEEFLIRLGISFERNVPVSYTDSDNKPHTTLIDYKVEDLLIEVKGSHLLTGTFAEVTHIEDKIKLYREKHIIVITGDTPKVRALIGSPNSNVSNGLKYLTKCPNPLIGIDIELFNNPYFPYPTDRPKCFYDTKVDRKPSIKEAWNNEHIRWKMIKNRIQYAGGFIDSHSIINALNITRTCKQPSWFSKNYAKDLINKYISTNIIIDGFAGYGMRHDAAIELNKEYHGIDLNKELVDWHAKHNRNIFYHDANTWTIPINKPHSIFICPPYTDYEVYFDGQDIEKTQEDWLDIMMKNFPNATEYLMVCKVVDKYKEYIVEEKQNNGVIGKNAEKVILIRNKNIT